MKQQKKQQKEKRNFFFGKEVHMKLGITMEGGANRTIFSCGVTDVFLDENIMPDYFIGASAGIAYGVSYLSKQKQRNLEIAKQFITDKRYMGLPYLLDKTKKTYFNLDFVFEEIPNKLLPFDYKSFSQFQGKVIAAVTNLKTGEAEYLDVPRDESFRNVLTASCALPVLFQPIKLNNQYYMDGGVADSIPFYQAIKQGCDKNIVILTRPRDYRKTTDGSVKIFSKIYKKYPQFKQAMLDRAKNYNDSLDMLFELEQQKKAYVIAPNDTLGVKRTEKDLDKLTSLYTQGVEIAQAQMKQIKDYLNE